MLSLDYLPLVRNTDHNFKHAVLDMHLGNLDNSLRLLEAATATHNNPDYGLLKGFIRRMMTSGRGQGPVSLVWQVSPALWEGDWLRMLLEGIYSTEVMDFDHKKTSDFMIVVDNVLGPEKEQYYRNAFEGGCRVCLIHLSDEAFRDDLSTYRWCDVVYRNYWSPIVASIKNVQFFPLGYKTGFTTSDKLVDAAERPNLWSFAGDPNKTTRLRMLDGMRKYAPGKVHLTSGFHASDNLTVTEYQELLGSSVLSPCPQGNINLDSYRVYESLESGCIPIVEKKQGFDYFTHLLGPNPIPSVEDWSMAPDLINVLLATDRGSRQQNLCHEWWLGKKGSLRAEFSEQITRAFS